MFEERGRRMKKKEVKKDADEIIEVQTFNHRKCIIRKKGSNGKAKYYQVIGNHEIEISTYEESLTDALRSCVFPIRSFVDTLESEDDDTGSIFFLMQDLIEVVESRLDDVGGAISKKCNIDLHRIHDGICGLNKGAVLGLTMKGEGS
jgi:hypothetical protein